MRLYLDTEFNGHGGELLSMALVSEHGVSPPFDSFYEVCHWRLPIDPWVSANVMPKLGKEPIRAHLFRPCFHSWIRHFDNPEIICDWHADAEHFCRLLAGNDYGSSLDFACRITILRTPPGQPVSANPHNALADARALRDWHELALAAV
jgi:transposase